MKIRILTHVNEYNKDHYHRSFEVIDEMPNLGDLYEDGVVTDITRIEPDCEDRSDDALNYIFYQVTVKAEDGNSMYYVAVENLVYALVSMELYDIEHRLAKESKIENLILIAEELESRLDIEGLEREDFDLKSKSFEEVKTYCEKLLSQYRQAENE